MKTYAKYLAELFGTFGLALVVSFSLNEYSVLATPLLAALTLGLFVYTVGHISGTHLNPAITFGALTIRKISLTDAVGYWIAQFIGAGLALFVSSKLLGDMAIAAENTNMVGVGEGLGALFFAFGVAAVMYGRVPKDLTGVAVGGSLLIGISLATHLSNGILNPAVALTLGSFNAWYVAGPLVGAALGMWLFKWISVEKK